MVMAAAVSQAENLPSAGAEVSRKYKHTEIGIVPEDWEVRSLGSIAPIETGSTPSTKDPSNYGDQFPFVSPVDLGRTKRISQTEKMLSQKGFASSRQFPAGAVLFVCIGSTIGKCGLAARLLTSNQQINAILPADGVSSEFLYYAVSGVAANVKALAGQQAVPIVNKTQFAETKIAFPPLKAEQEAISLALSDADALIESLESLIEKKRAIKQGAMQELLTGRRRLSGFSGEWSEKRLAQLGEVLNGLTYSPADVRESGTLVLRSSNIQNDSLCFDDSVFVQMDVPEQSRVKTNDILICVRNGSRDLIGKTVKLDERCEGMAFGAFMVVFRTRLHDFILHQFRSDALKKQISEHLGATINQITNKSLKSFVTKMPPTEDEAFAVAKLLADMDDEIALLTERLSKARAVKVALMQELLTGRVRLI